MFDKLKKEIEKLQKENLSIPISRDKDGYIDKECPNHECLFQFKVFAEDWVSLFKEEQVFCPMCRHEAPAKSWWTSEQVKEAKNQASKHSVSRFYKALSDSARDFNAKQPRNSFLKIRMSISPSKPIYRVIPIQAEEEMDLKIGCKQCGARYSVIGSAFFCPCCGHNSAEETFDNSIQKVRTNIKNLPIIRRALEEISKDEAEITCRSIIESSLNECVVAFQRFCEVIYSKKALNKKIKLNAFQNLGIGGEYWKELLGETYTDWLNASEFTMLNELFQKRHLLSHTEGIVDAKYIEKSGDDSYKVGQRIIIKEKNIEELVNLLHIVIAKIRST